MARNLAGTNLPAGNGGVTFPSPNEWPVTVFSITNIQKGNPTIVTAPDNGITLSSTASTPKIDFTQVRGMSQINGQFGFITSVIDSDNFTVAIDSTQFSPYTSGGFINITGGSSPDDPLTNLYS